MPDDVAAVKVLRLRRLSFTDSATYGQLFDDENRLICVTLELPWKDNAKGVSCIPAGTYPAHRYLSPKRGYTVFELADVPDRTHIEIHIGNTAADTEGCILVGSKFGFVGDKHGITESGAAFKRFMASLAGVDAFTLVISNP